VNEPFAAVYENGVLRPTGPLPLSEGAHVHVTIVETSDRNGDAAGARQAATVAALQSLIDAPDDELDDGYDFLEALNSNRSVGERNLFPPEQKGVSW